MECRVVPSGRARTTVTKRRSVIVSDGARTHPCRRRSTSRALARCAIEPLRAASTAVGTRVAGSFASIPITRASSSTGTSRRCVRSGGGLVEEHLREDGGHAVGCERHRRRSGSGRARSPSEKMSARPSTAPPRACSGAMYAGVPSVIPVRVMRVPCRELRDAEVDELDPVAAVVEKHVRRLDVAVDDAVRVRARERDRDRSRVSEDRLVRCSSGDRRAACASVSPTSHSRAR